MAGTLVNILPKRFFDFGTLALGKSQAFTLLEEFDISQYCDGILIVRVHAVAAAGGNMSFQLVPDGFTDRDPGVVFQSVPSMYFNTPVTIDSTVTGGTVIASGGVDGGFLGQYVALTVSGSRTVAAPAPINASISADLLMRSPDDSDGVVAQVVTSMSGCRCA